MITFKEIRRTIRWVWFLRRTHCLRGVRTVVEVGPGISKRIQFALIAQTFNGEYISLDAKVLKTAKIPFTSFKSRQMTYDFFQFKDKADLLIFDHSIDDILAFMIDRGRSGDNYAKVMDNIKQFNYQQDKFLEKVKKILNHSKKLLNNGGKIIIRNSPTEYDIPRKTVEKMERLIPYLVEEAKKVGLEVRFQSDGYLLLIKN